jgi:quinol monooxygenase YgiN
MSGIVVIARLRAVAGKRDELLEAIGEPIAESQAQDGCSRLVVHRDVNDPDEVTLIEWWRSQGGFEEHFQLPHMQALPKLTAGLQDGPPEVQLLEPLDLGDPAKGAYAELAR